MDLSKKEEISKQPPFKVGKVTLTTIKDMERIISRIEAWQRRPDVPEEIRHEVQQAKQGLMKVYKSIEEFVFILNK